VSMNNPIDANSPAFPVNWMSADSMGNQVVREQFSGINLRDYFAAKALQGLCALDWQSAYQQHMPSAEVYAEKAYCIADAMIKAREVSQ
jgi:hypothetical protein